MLIEEYFNYPYGRGPFTQSGAMVREKTASELVSYPTRITYKSYRTNTDHLVFACKIPSRTKKNVFYDVVFDLDVSLTDPGSSVTILKAPFTVFSNSPSFYYTFANAFTQKDLLCTWLRPKYERRILRKSPVKRNPAKVVAYERTIYTCLYVIINDLRHRSLTSLMWAAPLRKYREIAKEIQSQDDVETKYERAEPIKKKEEPRVRETHSPKPSASQRENASAHPSKVKKVSSSKSSSTSSRSKTVSKTKKL